MPTIENRVRLVHALQKDISEMNQTLRIILTECPEDVMHIDFKTGDLVATNDFSICGDGEWIGYIKIIKDSEITWGCFSPRDYSVESWATDKAIALRPVTQQESELIKLMRESINF